VRGPAVCAGPLAFAGCHRGVGGGGVSGDAPTMTTLTDIRTRVRKDLHDTDPATHRWTDTQLDRHVEHALDDLALAVPLEKTATLATTNGSRDLSLAALTGLIAVEAVEYPTGQYRPAYVPSSRWGDTLTLDVDPAPNGGNAKLYYTGRHTLDGSGSTIPAHFEDIVVLGASAYAAIELSSYTTDLVNTGGASVPRQYAEWGRTWLSAFRQLLHQHSRDNRVRRRRLYVPA
jgi:hypothetical protein